MVGAKDRGDRPRPVINLTRIGAARRENEKNCGLTPRSQVKLIRRHRRGFGQKWRQRPEIWKGPRRSPRRTRRTRTQRQPYEDKGSEAVLGLKFGRAVQGRVRTEVVRSRGRPKRRRNGTGQYRSGKRGRRERKEEEALRLDLKP